MSFKFYLYADINRAGTTSSGGFCCCYRNLTQNHKHTFGQMVYLGDNVAQKYKHFIDSGANIDSPFRYLKNQPYDFPENVDDVSASFDVDFFTKSVEITYFNDEEIILSAEITSALVRQERLTKDELLETRVVSNNFI